jgi:thiol-disulfide isomerase/thioredoxin
MEVRMRAPWRLLVAAAALGITLAGCGQSGGAGSTAPQPVDLEFTVPTVDGGTFHGSELSGQPAVLWFWAPWCVTCAAQAPHVTALAADYAGQVTVVGVAGLDDSLEAMQRFIELTDVGDLTHLADRDGLVWQRFAITTQSSFAVLDSDGVLVASGTIRPTDLPEHLDRLVG